MRFAEMAAPFFPNGEIIELHHDGKVDAPSGTAMRTMERMTEASNTWGKTRHKKVLPWKRGQRDLLVSTSIRFG